VDQRDKKKTKGEDETNQPAKYEAKSPKGPMGIKRMAVCSGERRRMFCEIICGRVRSDKDDQHSSHVW
jgi:hypothetical protein